MHISEEHVLHDRSSHHHLDYIHQVMQLQVPRQHKPHESLAETL